jgi:PHD/YefM family antitoxin component YafN of YafNO toxin-antitoxin module
MPDVTDREPVSVEKLQTQTLELVREVVESREAVPISLEGKPVAALLDLETYHEYIHLINMARSLLKAEADIRAGRVEPLDDVMNELLRGKTRQRRGGARRKRSHMLNPDQS